MKNKLQARLFVSFLVISALASLFIATSTPAQAARPYPSIELTGGPPVDTCSTLNFSLPVYVYVGTTGSDRGILEVPGYGIVFDYLENHSWFGPMDSLATYGVMPSGYSVAANTPLRFTLTTYSGPDGTGNMSALSWVEFDCTTGAVIGRYFGGGGFEGAPIPSGFQQHSIVCDTPVYDAPGGTPVGTDMVYAGQDWHLNTTPVAGPDGQNWTEIFVAGLNNAYIPTRCVGGPTVFN